MAAMSVIYVIFINDLLSTRLMLETDTNPYWKERFLTFHMMRFVLIFPISNH